MTTLKALRDTESQVHRDRFTEILRLTSEAAVMRETRLQLDFDSETGEYRLAMAQAA